MIYVLLNIKGKTYILYSDLNIGCVIYAHDIIMIININLPYTWPYTVICEYACILGLQYTPNFHYCNFCYLISNVYPQRFEIYTTPVNIYRKLQQY